MHAEPASTLLPCRLAITLETLQMAGASPWQGSTTALSTDQVQLVLSRRFEPGTLVSLGIDDGSGYTCLARITAIEAADHGWLLTCQLARPLDSQELSGLLLQAQPPAPPTPGHETVPEIASGQAARTHVDLKAVRERLGRLARQ